MFSWYGDVGKNAAVLLSLSIILFSGFLVTRLTKLCRLPNVSGFILAGVLIGPGVLNLVPKNIMDDMGFVSDIALAFIAFGVGKFFKKKAIKRTGKGVIAVTLFEALLAGLLVTLSVKALFAFDWDFCILLGAIATATAPASTMMTINQYHARGEYVNTLLQIVALDDVVCLLVFSVASSLINSADSGKSAFAAVMLPIAYNAAALLLGFVFGVILSRLLAAPTRSTDNRLILTVAMLLCISGLCAIVDISPLLSCMVFGATYINMTKDKALYKQVNSFTPPVMSTFFIVSGMSLDLKSLMAVGAVGLCYFAVRIIGKYIGAYLGCLAAHTSVSVRNYLGFALVPQAGVAIGLAFLGQRMLPAAMGQLLLTIILSSSVLYELIGPACAKAGLRLSGAITCEKTKDEEKKSTKSVGLQKKKQ
ncbi:MAG: cation:proton antiporter [Oscillospiraceae bacterium]